MCEALRKKNHWQFKQWRIHREDKWLPGVVIASCNLALVNYTPPKKKIPVLHGSSHTTNQKYYCIFMVLHWCLTIFSIVMLLNSCVFLTINRNSDMSWYVMLWKLYGKWALGSLCGVGLRQVLWFLELPCIFFFNETQGAVYNSKIMTTAQFSF